MPGMPKILLRVLLATGLLTASVIAHADASPAETPEQLWVHAGALSFHPNQDKHYNGNNLGLGLEYRLRPDLTLMAGGFSNSLNRDSVYLAMGYQPWTVDAWRFGVAVGVMNGYSRLGQEQVFPAAISVATYEGKRFGVNVGLIPDIAAAGVDGALVLQFKLRLR